MGYCYGTNPKTGRVALACDRCDKVGGVVKRPCPHGYCPAPALCAACNKATRADQAKYHADVCAPAQARAADRDARAAAVLATGAALRCSALQHPSGSHLVRVIFRDASGLESGADMRREVYHEVPLLEPATLEDYALVARTLGLPEPEGAPASFAFGA